MIDLQKEKTIIKELIIAKKDNIKDAEYFRNMTYEQLIKLIEIECKKGKSYIYLSTGIGSGFQKFLEDKGFIVKSSTTSYYVYW